MVFATEIGLRHLGASDKIRISPQNKLLMVGVAQLVRAPDCGSGGRGFETRHSPHSLTRSTPLGDQELKEFCLQLYNPIISKSSWSPRLIVIHGLKLKSILFAWNPHIGSDSKIANFIRKGEG